MHKEIRKMETFMAVAFLILHLVMVAAMDSDDPWLYDAIAIVLALSSIILTCRLAWDKFKKTL